MDTDAVARLDIGRLDRTGVPEAIFAAGKTLEQTIALVGALYARTGFALATRIPAEHRADVAHAYPDAVLDARASRGPRLEQEPLHPGFGILEPQPLPRFDDPRVFQGPGGGREVAEEVVRAVGDQPRPAALGPGVAGSALGHREGHQGVAQPGPAVLVGLPGQPQGLRRIHDQPLSRPFAKGPPLASRTDGVGNDSTGSAGSV